MRIVDEETRRIVMQNRIDGLENDKIFEKYKDWEAEIADEDIQSNDEAAEFVPD